MTTESKPTLTLEEKAEILKENEEAVYFRLVAILMDNGWEGSSPGYPRPSVDRTLNGCGLFVRVSEKDETKLELSITRTDRGEYLEFDKAEEILAFVSGVERELAAIIA